MIEQPETKKVDRLRYNPGLRAPKIFEILQPEETRQAINPRAIPVSLELIPKKRIVGLVRARGSTELFVYGFSESLLVALDSLTFAPFGFFPKSPI